MELVAVRLEFVDFLAELVVLCFKLCDFVVERRLLKTGFCHRRLPEGANVADECARACGRVYILVCVRACVRRA